MSIDLKEYEIQAGERIREAVRRVCEREGITRPHKAVITFPLLVMFMCELMRVEAEGWIPPEERAKIGTAIEPGSSAPSVGELYLQSFPPREEKADIIGDPFGDLGDHVGD